MENDLRGIENYFELMRGLSYRGFKLLGVDCTPIQDNDCMTQSLSYRSGPPTLAQAIMGEFFVVFVKQINQ